MSSKLELFEKLEWDPLFIASKEALKMIREDFVTRDEISKELFKFSKEVKANPLLELPSVSRYKLTLINQAHESIAHGIFSIEDIEDFKKYYSEPAMTIFATPRVLNADTELAWAAISPLIERLERWKKISELADSQVLNETQIEEAKNNIVNGERFSQSTDRSILFLDRMKYAKHKGIIDDAGYRKAVQLIPLMKKELLGEEYEPNVLNSKEVLAGISQGDKLAFEQQIAVEENVSDGFVEQSDPVNEWRRLVFILIDAWQAMLESELKSELTSASSCSDVNLLQEIHQYLVHLNREYLADESSKDSKNAVYQGKIRSFFSSKFQQVNVS